MVLLSIIIPCYNAGETLRRTLQSLQRLSEESRTCCEVILVDDGSTDQSFDILDEVRPAILPLNVVSRRQDLQGAGAARNAALDASSAPWVLFLDADDELAFDPIAYINQYPKASVLGFVTKFCRDGKHVWTRIPSAIPQEKHLDTFTAANPFPISSLVINRNSIRYSFNVEFMWLEDWLFWLENPSIFSNMVVFRKVISSIVHVSGRSKSSAMARHGKYRTMAAEKTLTELGARLSSKQRNNLMIQADIGRIQQGSSAAARTYFRFPCNMMLWTKLILYRTGIAYRIQPYAGKS